MEKLDKKNILYIGGALASVIALGWLWAKHSASSAAAAQQSADQQSSGIDPATAAYEAALGSGASLGSSPTSYGSSAPVSTGLGSSDLSTALPALIQALGLSTPVPVTAPTTDYSSQIAALYSADLGRAPTASDTQYYNSLGNRGTSLSTISQYIGGSPEAKSYQANQTAIANTNLVTNDFQTLLGRAPDASGLAFYSSLLASGTSADTITQYFENSPEYKALHSANTTAVSNVTAATSSPAASQPGAAIQISQPTAVIPADPKGNSGRAVGSARLLAG